MAHKEKPVIDPNTSPEEMLAQKTAIAERLIAEQDEIIHRELHRYEQATFYIRLQSQCFNLYPLLMRMIEDSRRRTIFRWIVDGKDIYELADRLNTTFQEIGATFCVTVRMLGKRTAEIFDFALKCDLLERSNQELLDVNRERRREDAALAQKMAELRVRIDSQEKLLRQQEEEAKRLRRKVEKVTRKWWDMRAEKWRVEALLGKLTHADRGFVGEDEVVVAERFREVPFKSVLSKPLFFLIQTSFSKGENSFSFLCNLYLKALNTYLKPLNMYSEALNIYSKPLNIDCILAKGSFLP